MREDMTTCEPSDFEDPLANYEPAEYSSELQRVLVEEAVESMPLAPCLQIRPSATVAQAIQAMASSRTASVVVVDGGRVIGIFTQRDVLERVAERYPKIAKHPVHEVMSTHPTVVYQSDPVAAALASIAVAGHRHVPVLDMDDRLMGVIGPRQVFEFLQSYLDR